MHKIIGSINNMATHCYINGEFKPIEGLILNHLGVGLFETMRVETTLNNDRIVCFLNRHLNRLKNGLRELQIRPPPEGRVIGHIHDALNNFDWRNANYARLRVIVLENDWILTIEPWQSRFDLKRGVKCITFSGERSLPHLKTCSAVVSVMAARAAEVAEAGEALLTDRNGIILEGAWSNFIWIDRAGVITTPNERILPGITRGVALEILDQKLGEKKFASTLATKQEILTHAQEAFITQSSHGIVPVVEIDGEKIGTGYPGEVTKKLIALYQGMPK